MDIKKLVNLSVTSKISGMLATIAAMRGATITDQLAIEAECAEEQLEEVIGDMIDGVSEDEEITFESIRPDPFFEEPADQ